MIGERVGLRALFSHHLAKGVLIERRIGHEALKARVLIM